MHSKRYQKLYDLWYLRVMTSSSLSETGPRGLTCVFHFILLEGFTLVMKIIILYLVFFFKFYIPNDVLAWRSTLYISSVVAEGSNTASYRLISFNAIWIYQGLSQCLSTEIEDACCTKKIILIYAIICYCLGYIFPCWTSIWPLTKYIVFVARLAQQSLIPESRRIIPWCSFF